MTGRLVFAEPPAIVGHRGFGKGIVRGHRENTLQAFLAAVEQGLAWVEVDVRRTADDHLVVLHLPTTAPGDFAVDLTGDQVARTGVLPLQDLLDVLPAHVGVDIDLKPSLEDAPLPLDRTTLGLALPVIAREAARRPVLVTSFDPSVLLHVRERLPNVPLGLLTWLYFPLRKAVPAAAHLGVDVVAAHTASFWVNSVDPAPIHRTPAYTIGIAHEAGLQVMAWCPKPADALTLVLAGVDAVCADDVRGVKTALGDLPATGD